MNKVEGGFSLAVDQPARQLMRGGVLTTIRSGLLGVFFLASVSVSAGTMVSMDINDEGNIVEQTLFVEGGKIAIAPSNANGQFIYDAQTRVITIINHDEQSFYSLTEADIESALGMASMFTGTGIQSFIAAQIESLPADQQAEARRMLESMGGGADPEPPTTVERSGTMVTVNGMNCEILIVRKADRQMGEACIGSANALGIPTDDWETFNSFLDMSWRFVGQAAKIASQFGQTIPDLGMQKIEGVPIQFIDVNSPDKPMLKLTGIQSANMPQQLIAIPQGYRQAKLPLLQ